MAEHDTDQYNRQKLLEKIAEADLSPFEIAMVLGLSLEEVADFATQPSMMRTLQGMARLADIRAQLLLSRHRADAALRLIAIASTNEPSELSRKACVDLLEMDLEAFSHLPPRVNDEPK